MGADLVEEHGVGISNDYMAVAGLRELAVDELEGVELGLDDGSGVKDLFSEFGVVAVGDDGQLAKEVIGLLDSRLLVGGAGLDAEDLIRVLAMQRLDNLCFHHGDVLMRETRLSQLRDEAPMVKPASNLPLPTLALAGPLMRNLPTLIQSRIRNHDLLAVVKDGVPVAGDRINVLQAVLQAELPQGVDAAGLEQLADDAVGLLHPSLEQEYGAALVGEGVCDGAAKDAGADDDDVGLVVSFAAAGLRGRGCRGRRHGFWRGRRMDWEKSGGGRRKRDCLGCGREERKTREELKRNKIRSWV